MGVVREAPGDKLRPGVYFYYDCVIPGVYTRSGVYLDQACNRSYTVHVVITHTVAEETSKYMYQEYWVYYDKAPLPLLNTCKYQVLVTSMFCNNFKIGKQ